MFFQGLAKAICLIGVFVCCLTPGFADPLDRWTLRFRYQQTDLFTHWDVAFGNGLFVAVGHFGGDFGSIYSSPDGVTWTARHQLPDPTNNYTFIGGELRRILFVNGRFVTVGWNYFAYASDNGMDWHGGVSPGLGSGLEEGFRDMCYGQGKFVAIDGRSNSNILTSLDGLLWTRQPVFQNGLQRISYGNGTFVALGEPNPSLRFTPYLTSTDGTNWMYHRMDSLLVLSGLTWAKGLFVAAGHTYYGPPSSRILTSSNGVSWTQLDVGLSNLLTSVQCINGLFITTGDSILLTSTNGINWDSRPSTNRIARFTFGNGTLVAIFGGVAYGYWGRDLYQTEPLLKLGVHRATPQQISITGIVGQKLRLEYAGDSSATTWQPISTFSLPTSPYSWTDDTAVGSSTRLYRSVWLP